MPRKQQGWITFQSSEEEREILEKYCYLSQRTKTEILRELVRSLPKLSPVSDASTSVESSGAKIITEDSDIKSMKFSARNVLKGKITRMVMGTVNTEVFIEIAPNIQITSVITTVSAENLGLKLKKTVYAVIKSSSFMLGDEEILIE
jgi:molybdopterin-binding protein